LYIFSAIVISPYYPCQKPIYLEFFPVDIFSRQINKNLKSFEPKYPD